MPDAQAARKPYWQLLDPSDAPAEIFGSSHVSSCAAPSRRFLGDLAPAARHQDANPRQRPGLANAPVDKSTPASPV